MTTAMHGRADTSAEDEGEDAQLIDLSTLHASPPAAAPSLYGPRPGDATLSSAAPAPSPTPAPSAPTAPATAVVDAEGLARLAAEVAVSVERHRQELAAAMAELTALQRTLRSEVRSVIAELDRIAEGVAPASAPTTSPTSPTPDPAPDASGSVATGSSRWSIPNRLRRAH